MNGSVALEVRPMGMGIPAVDDTLPSADTPLKMLSEAAKLVYQMTECIDDVQRQVVALKESNLLLKKRIEDFADLAADKSSMAWVVKMKAGICQAYGWNKYGNPKTAKMYEDLEKKTGCNLRVRLVHLKNRMRRSGMKAQEVNNLGYLDAISVDKKLREEFQKIVLSYIDSIK